MSGGRPGQKMLDSIMDEGSYAELKKATQDRDIVINLPNGRKLNDDHDHDDILIPNGFKPQFNFE